MARGTDELEGYSLEDKGYFGPGELPHFDRDLFEIPHGREEDWLFQQFKEKLISQGVPGKPELEDFASNVKEILDKGETTFDIA